MPIHAKDLFVASMDMDADKDALLHGVYEGCDHHPTENLREGTGR
jgi:hypothetical protein